MAPLRSRPTKYEDLPNEIRARIMLNQAEGDQSGCGYVVRNARGAGWMPRRPYLNEWVEDVLRSYGDHQFRMTMRGRIGGEGQDDYSPYNRMRRSP
eukprot:scaffold9944_cov111-Isochrysis_galbana.AAC.3